MIPTEAPMWSTDGIERGPDTPPDFAPIPMERSAGDLYSAFAGRVSDQPEAIAVVEQDRSYSYRHLDRLARGLSRLIRKEAPPGTSVAILAESGIDATVGMLAACAAGRPFVPLDPTQHDSVLIEAAQLTRVRMFACDVRFLSQAQRIANQLDHRVGCFELRQKPNDAKPTPASPSATACVFFTSGSTGRAKGVVMSHRFLLRDVIRSIHDGRISRSDRCDQLFAPSFSASLVATFSTLIAGGELHPLNTREWLHRLRRFQCERDITYTRLTPTLLRIATEGAGTTLRPRVASVGGEPLTSSDLSQLWKMTSAHTTLLSAYASTEARTVTQRFLRVDDGVSESHVAGHPVWDREVIILDETGTPCPTGHVGEIVIRAETLANGYLTADPALSGRFRIAPDGRRQLHTGDRGLLRDDGQLVLKGREDGIVKVRGQQVELSDVQSEFERLTEISNAAVIPFLREDGATGLAAFVVATEPPRSIAPGSAPTSARPWQRQRSPSRSFSSKPYLTQLTAKSISEPCSWHIDSPLHSAPKRISHEPLWTLVATKIGSLAPTPQRLLREEFTPR